MSLDISIMYECLMLCSFIVANWTCCINPNMFFHVYYNCAAYWPCVMDMLLLWFIVTISVMNVHAGRLTDLFCLSPMSLYHCISWGWKTVDRVGYMWYRTAAFLSLLPMSLWSIGNEQPICCELMNLVSSYICFLTCIFLSRAWGPNVNSPEMFFMEIQ